MLVTICIPSLESRAYMLERALRSVRQQAVPDGIQVGAEVQLDREREGAWTARNLAAERALAANADWVGFLDDDDELLPFHVRHLLGVADEWNAVMVWGWFQIVYPEHRVQPEGVGDPFAHLPGDSTNGGTGYRGRQYNPAQPHVVPITYLVRADVLAQALDRMGGFQADTIGSWDTQDQPLIDTIYELSGGALRADMRTTWLWYHHGRNTSGMPDRH